MNIWSFLTEIELKRWCWTNSHPYLTWNPQYSITMKRKGFNSASGSICRTYLHPHTLALIIQCTTFNTQLSICNNTKICTMPIYAQYQNMHNTNIYAQYQYMYNTTLYHSTWTTIHYCKCCILIGLNHTRKSTLSEDTFVNVIHVYLLMVFCF